MDVQYFHRNYIKIHLLLINLIINDFCLLLILNDFNRKIKSSRTTCCSKIFAWILSKKRRTEKRTKSYTDGDIFRIWSDFEILSLARFGPSVKIEHSCAEINRETFITSKMVRNEDIVGLWYTAFISIFICKTTFCYHFDIFLCIFLRRQDFCFTIYRFMKKLTKSLRSTTTRHNCCI